MISLSNEQMDGFIRKANTQGWIDALEWSLSLNPETTIIWQEIQAKIKELKGE